MNQLLTITVLFLLAMSRPAFDNKHIENDKELLQKAIKLAHETIIIDSHIDAPYRFGENKEDISQRTESGDFDYPRAKQGGLNAAFMSIFVPPKCQETGGAKELADSVIDLVEKVALDFPDKFAIAISTEDIKKQFHAGKISLPMGMENGAGIEDNLENLKHFYGRGIRYITLSHSKSNLITDSSFDKKRKWNGLSPFGEKVIAEMNRLGIIIDVSHVTDSAFYDVMKLTKAPVIASHSSCRYFTPGWERNMSDKMIKALAKNGGVIQINFGSIFINTKYNRGYYEVKDKVNVYIKENDLDRDSEETRNYKKELLKEKVLKKANVSDVADHIDHVVDLAGINHVGIGSDYDGSGPTLPIGLEDVSKYPNLICELLRRGYSEKDIEKICSGNLLRVWSEVERIAMN
ncbi:MAG: dipeptidase [Bacteroidota bacterium]